MKIKVVKLSDIIPYFNNARNNMPAIEPTKESIKRYGFIKPIIVDRAGIIICGHTRYFASFQLGLTEVPVIYSDLDDDRAMQYRILDNKLAEKSSYDENSLLEELKRLKVPMDMQVFFFEDINTLLNFSYNSITAPQANYEDYDTDEDEIETVSVNETASASHNVYSADDEDDEDYVEEEIEDAATDLYKVRYENGKKIMKVICAFCGNIEEIEIE